MNGEENGLTLQRLAHRLEALEHENAELRSKVAALEGSETGRAVEEPAYKSEKRVSRSWLLRNAGAAAVGTMAAGALLARDASVAKADHFGPGITVDFVVTHLEAANLTAVFGDAPNGEGVVGRGRKHGVRGEGDIGVRGRSSTQGQAGVYTEHTSTSGPGVVGDGLGSFAGVWGRNRAATGVKGEGIFGVQGAGQFVGIDGWTTTTQGGYGVRGYTAGISGTGVVGNGKGIGYSGVSGLNDTGTGVKGQGAEYGVHGESTTTGTGVYGESQSGYGGQFRGGRAQLWLTPASTAGKPTTGAHVKGEIFMDSTTTLWVCAASGTPGVWRRVTTTAT